MDAGSLLNTRLLLPAFPRSRDLSDAHPPDTGCVVAPLCVNCPLPACVHDDPYSLIRWKRQQRDARVAALAAQGVAHGDIAVTMGVTLRTVFRSLARTRSEEDDGQATSSPGYSSGYYVRKTA